MLLPEEDLSPRPKRSERSGAELVVVVLGLLILLALDEAVGVAEEELLVFESLKSPLKPEPTSSRSPSLDGVADVGDAADEVDKTDAADVADAAEVGVDTLAESGVEVTVGVVEGGELVVESPPRIPPNPKPRSRRLSLEVEVEVEAGEVEAGAVETLTDESTVDPSLLVDPASAEAASEFFWVVFSVLEPSVFWVVVVVVAVGSPPMVVVPVIRWVISGFLGSTEIVTTTTSCPVCG